MPLKFIRQPVGKIHQNTQTEPKYCDEASAAAVGDDTEIETLPEKLEAAMNLEDAAPQVDRLQVKPDARESMSDILEFVEWPAPEELNFHIWTQEECQQLLDIAALKKYKDWDAVAKALNTGRTGYQCYVFLRTQALRREEMVAKWSTTDTAILESIVYLFKMDNRTIPWGRVANSMMTRTKMECYVKYNMMSELARKGKYLDEEDCVLLSFVELYGYRFRELSCILVGRSSIQLSARYKLLMKLKKLSTWTIEDDIKLNYIRTSWPLAEGETFRDVIDTAIEQNIKCFPNWDAENLKERCNLLEAWNANNPTDEDLSTALGRDEWDQIKPKKGNIHFAQALLELSNKLAVELQSYQEAVWKKKNKKNSDVQNFDKCPFAT